MTLMPPSDPGADGKAFRLSLGAFHHPALGQTHCGDAYEVIDRGTHVIVAVVDGLGHGVDAEIAAQLAISYLRAHPDASLRMLLEGCHKALKGSRGAAMAIARIDRRRHRLSHAGVGNVETRLVSAGQVLRPITMNGIVGESMERFREETFPFVPGDLLFMYSDGISDRFETPVAARDLQRLADQIALKYLRFQDDQTLVILRDETIVPSCGESSLPKLK